MFARNAGQADVSALTLQQAKWLQEINDWKGASEMYMAMGQFLQAAKIIAVSLFSYLTFWKLSLTKRVIVLIGGT